VLTQVKPNVREVDLVPDEEEDSLTVETETDAKTEVADDELMSIDK
jgi:hypothetical protein